MGNYRNPYEDFPARCHALWERMEQANQNADRDLSVTAMLMVATSGFASPWEFLKHDGSYPDRNSHPAFDGVNEEQYGAALRRVSNEISRSFLDSTLFSNKATRAWRFGHCDEMQHVRNLADRLWHTNSKPIPAGMEEVASTSRTARDALKILRNALAHGNVCALVGRANEIDRLVFFSEDSKWVDRVKTPMGWHVATVTIDGFREFLSNWFALIREPRNFLVLSVALEEQHCIPVC